MERAEEKGEEAPPYTTLREGERGEALVAASERLGKILGEIWHEMRVGMLPEDSQKHREPTRFLFHAWGKPWVEVVGSEYDPKLISDETLTRSFTVLAFGSKDDPIRHWIINEVSSRSGGRKYEPYFFEYRKDKEYARKMEGRAPEWLEKFVDPTPEDIEETARAIEAAWQAFVSGDSDAVQNWAARA